MRVLLKKNQMIKCLEMRQTAVSLTVEDSDRQKHRQTEKMNERGERGSDKPGSDPRPAGGKPQKQNKSDDQGDSVPVSCGLDTL